jgi:sugar phosphate isomerase/epimerase
MQAMDRKTTTLGIERLCLFGMPPVEHVRLAAELGCGAIGIGFTPVGGGYNPHGYRDWSLRKDPALRADLRRACADHGIRIALLEGFAATASDDIRRLEPDLDLAAELGAERIAVAATERDPVRTAEQFTTLTELARASGLATVSEIGMGAMRDLPRAVAVAQAVAQAAGSGFSLLIDTMHFFRLGSTVAQLAAIDPALIGYVQLCDAPLSGTGNYMEEAFFERRVPGEGELPLPELLALVPDDVVVSVEVPRRRAVEAGLGPVERVRPCIEAARAMLDAR